MIRIILALALMLPLLKVNAQEPTNMAKWKIFHNESLFKVQDYYIHSNSIMLVSYDNTLLKIIDMADHSKRSIVIDLKEEKGLLTGPIANSKYNFSSLKGELAFFPLISSSISLDFLIATVDQKNDNKLVTKVVPLDVDLKKTKFLPELYFFGNDRDLLV